MRLEDVAKRAKVSISTVSRVVNKRSTVRGSTRKRVLAILDELNYTPNLQARLLVSGQSNTLGLIVSNLEDPFIVDLYQHIEEQAARQGYELLLANTNYDPERFSQTLQMMLGRCVAGLAILASEALPRETSDEIAGRIPVVCFNSGDGQPGFIQLRLNARKGMQKILKHLHSLGHRRLAYIGQKNGRLSTSDRYDAFVLEAETLGMEYVTVPIAGRDGCEEGRDAVQQLAAMGFNAGGIVCANDITAFGALRELRNRNVDVPDQISVTGFDNIAISEFSCPSLTTAHIPRDKVAAAMLRALTAKPGEAVRELTFDPELIVRESTGPYFGNGLVSSK
jgi:LacI family transcriptional regulator